MQPVWGMIWQNALHGVYEIRELWRILKPIEICYLTQKHAMITNCCLAKMPLFFHICQFNLKWMDSQAEGTCRSQDLWASCCTEKGGGRRCVSWACDINFSPHNHTVTSICMQLSPCSTGQKSASCHSWMSRVLDTENQQHLLEGQKSVMVCTCLNWSPWDWCCWLRVQLQERSWCSNSCLISQEIRPRSPIPFWMLLVP